MAAIKGEPRIGLEVTLTLSELECRALLALTGYSDADFLRVFYANLGEHYLKPNEAGLLFFFRSIRELLPAEICKVDAARAAFNKRKGNA